MAWTKKEEIPIETPKFIIEAKKTLDEFYQSTLVPLVGPSYPPYMGGSVGTVIETTNKILTLFETRIVDPFSTFIKNSTSQVNKTVKDLANSGVHVLIVHPYNVDGANIKRIPIRSEDLPNNFKLFFNNYVNEGANSITSSINNFMSEKEEHFLNLKNLTSFRSRVLSPSEAIQAAVNSLDDANDFTRPQFTSSAYVAGVGFFITASTYVDFMKSVNMIADFLTIKDFSDFADSFSNKVNSKIKIMSDWNEVLEEWFRQTRGETTYGKHNLILIKELHDSYKRAFPKNESGARSKTFASFLEDYFNNIHPEEVFSMRPDWYSLTLANTISIVKDFYEAVQFYTEQLNAYIQEASSSTKELITIIKQRIQDLVNIVTNIIQSIAKFADLPSFSNIHTLAFSGIGGNELIKKEISDMDLTGIENNDFSCMVLVLCGTASDDFIKNFASFFGEMTDSWKSAFEELPKNEENAVVPEALSSENNPNSSRSLSITSENYTPPEGESPILPETPHNEPAPALPSQVTQSASTSESLISTNSGEKVLVNPEAYSVHGIVNGTIYPPIAPYWENDTTVSVTAYLRECKSNYIEPLQVYSPFTSKSTINGKPGSITYYNLRVITKKLSNNLETEVTYNFGIDSSLIKPRKIYPSNVVNAKTYPTVPFRVLWDEVVGVTSSAILEKNFNGTWRNWDYVDNPLNLGTGIYIKGYSLANGLYRVTIKSAETKNLSNFSTTITYFTVDSTAVFPTPRVIEGVDKYKTYTVDKQVTWLDDTDTVETKVKIQFGAAEPIEYTSAQKPITINQNGVYRFTVKTINKVNPGYYIQDSFAITIDKDSPQAVQAKLCSEIFDNASFTYPIPVYWTIFAGTVSEGFIKNKTGYMVYNKSSNQVKVVSFTGAIGSKYWFDISSIKEEDDSYTRHFTVYSSQEKTTDSIVCKGYRTGNGDITLAEENSSGMSGIVNLVYNEDTSLTDNYIIPPNIEVPCLSGETLGNSGMYELRIETKKIGTTISNSKVIPFSITIP